MTNPDVVRLLHAMWDAHNAAFAAIRRASEETRDATDHQAAAITSLTAANAAHDRAYVAHDEVIAAALVANQAAIDLLHTLTRDPP